MKHYAHTNGAHSKVVLEGDVDDRKRKGEEEMQRKGLAFQTK